VWAPAGLVKIHDKPDRDSPVLGAIRAGQSVRITDAHLTDARRRRRLYQCTEGWYPVAPRGFVCVGGPGHGTRNGQDPAVLAAAAALPDTSAVYPYHYGVSVGAPQYLRIPTAAEQRQVERDLDAYLAKLPAPDGAKGGAVDPSAAGAPPPPALLSYFASTKLPLTDEEEAFEGKKVAWARQFDAAGRTWLLTPDMRLIPKDKVRVRPLPKLQGIDLKAHPEIKLPLAFVWLGDAARYHRDEGGEIVRDEGSWQRHSFIETTGKMAKGHGHYYWEMRDGRLASYSDVTIIKRGHRPRSVHAGEKWVEVRVTWGYLLAYEGDEPVYVTAMSPGVDGIAARGHATARGYHYVDWKMITGDMSGTDKRKYWFVDEVPWVAYYKDNYAVHGAWWHNDFGRPKSHGCVNLPPAAARFMFHWMDPQIPEGWYAASAHYPFSRGTMIYIHQ